ncbi:MAG: hypothetical protein IKA47_14050 [Oscillospiraceae bacterium]|nr:hypothetical protein [Oscillospiraceae bacterium]MBR2311629.1 hypothetical protein [Oscillospiraceae bacterium]
MPELNPREMQQALAQPFAPEDLEWRLQNTIEDKMRGMAVPYVTNRAIQNRLDEVCGPENWYNDFKPWHTNGKKESQLCGIAIYFEGRGFITKWDGAEDSDIEPVKGGLSDSMKRAAYQWGIGRVLYSLDTVWVDIERRGRSYVIKDSERAKLDNAYLSTLQRLGLKPAEASGIQSLLTPKSAPEQKAPKNENPAPVPTQQQPQSQKNNQSRPAPAQQPAPQQGQQPQRQQISRQTAPTAASAPNSTPIQESRPAGKTMPFNAPQQTAQPQPELYTILDAKIQGGMSGSNTLVHMEAPNKKQLYAYVRGAHSELVRGIQLFNVKLTTRKQDTVAFHVLEFYEIYPQTQQAA